MSTQQLDRLRPAGVPARIGQATAVEQSRAVAEVQAQVIVAQQFPRSMQAAVRAMEEACAQPALAGRALFRYPRGKDDDGNANILSGPSVHLARELARCFGNLQYGITEMARDDDHGQSEMMAWAWDMEANTRSSTTFIVPHKRDTRFGAKDLTDLRDIYENNANNGGRRVREMIFAVLPGWYVTRALELCAKTNEHGGGKPLAERIATAVKLFEQYRVSPAWIAAKWGYRSVDELTATDVAQLAVIYSSLQQGTVSVADEFPAAETAGLVTAADLAPPKSPSPAGTDAPPSSAPSPVTPQADVPPAGEAPSPGPAPGDPAWQRALKAAQAQFKRFTGDDQAARLDYARRILRVNEVLSFSDLTLEELRQIGEVLSGLKDRDALDALLDAGEAAQRGGDGQAGDE